MLEAVIPIAVLLAVLEIVKILVKKIKVNSELGVLTFRQHEALVTPSRVWADTQMEIVTTCREISNTQKVIATTLERVERQMERKMERKSCSS